MRFVSNVTAVLGSIQSANRFGRLMALSDRELEMRGLSRDTLKRAYLDSIGTP